METWFEQIVLVMMLMMMVLLVLLVLVLLMMVMTWILIASHLDRFAYPIPHTTR